MRVSRKAEALGWSLGFLVLGLGAVVAAKELIDLDQGEVLLAVLVLPALVYLLLSGQLSELSLGPVAAKMAEPVGAADFSKLDQENVDSVTAQVQRVVKGSREDLVQILVDMKRGAPPILHLQLGVEYGREVVAQYLDDLALFPGFRFVAFERANGEFVAYAPHESIRSMLSLPERSAALLEALRSGNEEALLRIPAVLTRTVSPTMTKREALRLMLDDQLGAMLVVAEGRARGVVDRASLLTEFALDLGDR